MTIFLVMRGKSLPVEISFACSADKAAGMLLRGILLGTALFEPGVTTNGDLKESLGVVYRGGRVAVLGLRELPLHRLDGVGAQGTDDSGLTTVKSLCLLDAFTKNHFFSDATAGGTGSLLIFGSKHRCKPLSKYCLSWHNIASSVE